LAGKLPRAAQDFRHELDVLATTAAQLAWEQGRLSAERLAALVYDPQALRALHDRLESIGDEGRHDEQEAALPRPSASAVRAHQGGVPEGLTKLLSGGQLDEFKRRFEPWLPYLLDELGLDGQDEQQRQELMRFVCGRLGDLGDRRFSKVLPEWLREFARMSQPLAEDFLRRFVERAAVRHVLEAPAAHEPRWAAAFRRQALNTPPDSPLGLLHFQPDDVSTSAPSLAAFRRNLFREAKLTCAEGFDLFQLSLN
jgi:hypothetical protein